MEILQRHDQVIDIADWEFHQDFEVFPLGARDKSLRVCPRPAPFGFCVPGHRYLFKEAIKSSKDPGQQRYPDQYWSEVIAFRIGRMMGLTLPPVFVAIDSAREEPGTVNEWFLGYGGSDERFSAGGDYMQKLVDDYDRERGRKHNLYSIVTLSRALERAGMLSQDWRVYWGLGLCFDALIGNTDRHQENWGLIWFEDGGRQLVKFAPYFDNGTSLGHELQSRKMQRMMRDSDELNAYLSRGRHQMRWSLSDDHRLPLINGVVRFCEHYQEIRPLVIERLMGIHGDELTGMLESLTCFDIPHPLSPQRAEFVAFLTMQRRSRLLQALEN